MLCLIVAHQNVAASSIYQPSTPSEPYSYHFDPYSYGYDVEDNYGNKQWKQEKSNNPHEVHGSYGYKDKNGIYREVSYVADKNGFRANIKTNEPGSSGAKDPASVKVESHYSPAAPQHVVAPVAAAPHAPLYAPKQYSSAVPTSYYQRS